MVRNTNSQHGWVGGKLDKFKMESESFFVYDLAEHKADTCISVTIVTMNNFQSQSFFIFRSANQDRTEE